MTTEQYLGGLHALAVKTTIAKIQIKNKTARLL